MLTSIKKDGKIRAELKGAKRHNKMDIKLKNKSCVKKYGKWRVVKD